LLFFVFHGSGPKQDLKNKERPMKWSTTLRLFASPLLAVLLLASVPSVRATVFQDTSSSFRESDKNNKKKEQVPEGSAGAFLVLTVGALGGGLLVWRRKKRATAA
jgi:hypothetical protein